MLLELHIENLALIKEVNLSLGPGLNVLTGETGAGKSIVVDAMNLLVGGRAVSELVRTGAERALIEGVFDYDQSSPVHRQLKELGLPLSEDNTLLLGREVVRQGRSVCRVNGRVVPLSMYRSLGELLVDLHGQHEHQSLLQVDRHLDLLDQFGGRSLLQKREQVAGLYQRLVQLKTDRKRLAQDARELTQRADYLRHAIAEIDGVKPRQGEEAELERERDRLRYGEKLAELAKEITGELFDGAGNLIPAYDLLSRAAAQAQEMAGYDKGVEQISKALEDIRYRLDDVSGALREYRENLAFDPAHARQVEERLYTLKNLMRKYGTTLEEVCAYRDQAASQLEKLSQVQNCSGQLETEYQRALSRYEAAAHELSALRREHAAVFAAAVARELHGLGMRHARFELAWEQLTAPAPTGRERVEFLFSANPGEPPKPLAKIASGGEMSRVMLALKVILAETDHIPTLIFDEIDTGIGGRTLQVVGERLSAVARTRQVLCVTHSAHIAGRGQRHFYIEKRVVDGQTHTVVHPLNRAERVAELARMLGGSADEAITRRHAEQLLKQQ